MDTRNTVKSIKYKVYTASDRRDPKERVKSQTDTFNDYIYVCTLDPNNNKIM